MLRHAVEAFRWYAAQVAGKEYPLEVKVNAAEIERGESREVWAISTKDSSFEGMTPDKYMAYVFLGDGFARTGREHYEEAKRQSLAVCCFAVYEQDRYAVLILTEDPTPRIETLFLGELAQ